MQAIGPDLGGHRPVSEAGVICPPSTEPAVVERITFHPDRRRELGKLQQSVKIVVEVDGLPDVESDRPLNRRMPLSGPKVAMKTAGDRIQTDGVRTADPRRAIRFTFAEDHFTG